MYLNLDGQSKDRYVYRITTVDRVKELFASKRNTLVKPRLWGDPYENFILSSKVRLKSGEVVEYNFHETMYGQCWTFHSASDAMWRIYSEKKNGVRLRSTIASLARGLAIAHPHLADAQCRVGRVQYLSAKKMKRVANNTFDDYGIGVNELFGSLLVKRTAFSHERELRVLYCELNDSSLGNSLYPYEVDPHAMIDQMVLDPRLAREEADSMKEELRRSTGFNGPILRSLLYAPPQEGIVDVSDWEP
jgi:hypothetical protein